MALTTEASARRVTRVVEHCSKTHCSTVVNSFLAHLLLLLLLLMMMMLLMLLLLNIH